MMFRILLVLVLFLPGLCLLAISFPYNIDLSDEGLYYYNLLFGMHYANFNHYFLVFDDVSRALDLSLNQIRWLTFGLYVGSTAILWREFKRAFFSFYSRPMNREYTYLFFLSLYSMYAGISTLSYNSVSFLAGAFLLSFFVRLWSRKMDLACVLYLLAALYFAPSARLSLGAMAVILSFLATSIYIYRTRDRMGFVWFAASLAGAGALIFWVLRDDSVFYANILPQMKILAQSSHINLHHLYAKEVSTFLLRYVAVPGIVYWLFCRASEGRIKWSATVVFHSTYLVYGVFRHLVFEFTYYRFFKILLGQILILLGIAVWRGLRDARTRALPREIEVAIGSLLVCVAVSFGSNNGLIFRSSGYVTFLVIPLVVLLERFFASRHFSWALVGIVWALGLQCLWFYQFEHYYRSPARSETNYVFADYPGLSGHKIPHELDLLLRKSQDFLAGQNIDREHDALLVYSDMPGVAAALRIRTIGNPLLLSIYPGIQRANCFYLEKDPGNYRNIYLYLSRQMPDELDQCVRQLLEPSESMSSVVISHFEQRSGEMVQVKIEGPYRLRAPGGSN